MIQRKLRRHMRRARLIMYHETLVDIREHIWTFIGAFIGIGAIGLLNSKILPDSDNLFLIGSFGASAVLVYGIINSPLAQPRNLVGGHVVSALVGVTIYKLVPGELWLTASLSVALAIVMMQITKTLHPPGGATALIANIGTAKVKALGYWYVLSPVLSGVTILLLVAIICNNATSHRSYPQNKYWFKFWKREYKPHHLRKLRRPG